MEEKTIVKVFNNNKLIIQKTYTNYDKALDYALSSTKVGYSCLILRQVEEKDWVRLMLYPKG